jgi:hypothetical protein
VEVLAVVFVVAVEISVLVGVAVGVEGEDVVVDAEEEVVVGVDAGTDAPDCVEAVRETPREGDECRTLTGSHCSFGGPESGVTFIADEFGVGFMV